MTNRLTISNSSAESGIKRVPTALILFAVTKWTPCFKYAKKTGVGNNTNQFIRNISAWLILKNETSSAVIQNYRTQLQRLAAKCKISERTLRSRIAWMKSEGLVHEEGKDLVIHKYEVLKKKYSINIKQREQTILYNETDNTSLAETIIAIAIKKMQERWMEVYWKKLTQNPDEYKTLYDFFIHLGADAAMLHDREYFRQCHLEAIIQAYEEEKPGQPAYDLLHKILKNANPDLNCTAATYANKFGYSEGKEDENGEVIPAAMSFCQLKFRLAKKGLLEFEKGHVNSMCCSRKDEKIYHHRFVRKTKEIFWTVWFRPDQITIKTEAIFEQPNAIFGQKNAA